VLGFPPHARSSLPLLRLATLDFAWEHRPFYAKDFNGLFLSLIKKLLVISFFLRSSHQWPVLDSCHCDSFAQLGATAREYRWRRIPQTS